MFDEARQLWEEHTAGRGKEPLWLSLVGILIAASVGVLTAPYSLAESMGLHVASPEELFLGAVTATLVGGVIIGICRRTLALVLTMMGIDVEKTWLDEVLGIFAGGLILQHFGADLMAVALFALSDLIPGLIQSVITHYRPASEADTRAAPVLLAGNKQVVPQDLWPVR
jgi:hypothetical protein